MLDQFNLEIEKKALRDGSYREAVINFSAEKDIEIEEVVELLNPIIKKKIEDEFINANAIPSRKVKTSLANIFKD